MYVLIQFDYATLADEQTIMLIGTFGTHAEAHNAMSDLFMELTLALEKPCMCHINEISAVAQEVDGDTRHHWFIFSEPLIPYAFIA